MSEIGKTSHFRKGNNEAVYTRWYTSVSGITTEELFELKKIMFVQFPWLHTS